jgi:hypothetical protein
MLPPNLDPGSSGVEIGQATENAIPATARFVSVQAITLSGFWSRGSVVVDFGSAVLDHATVDTQIRAPRSGAH